MTMSLSSFLLLLAPLLAAIIIMRPSWLEFFLLVLPLIAAIVAALFAFRAASYLLLGLIGLLIGLSGSARPRSTRTWCGPSSPPWPRAHASRRSNSGSRIY